MKKEAMTLNEAIRRCSEADSWNAAGVAKQQVNEWLCELKKLRETQEADGWTPVAQSLPDENAIVNVAVLHHEWVNDYDCDWVVEEEKEIHPAYKAVTAAKYVGNGEFMCLDAAVDEESYFAEAFPENADDLSAAVVEVLAWRPLPKM